MKLPTILLLWLSIVCTVSFCASAETPEAKAREVLTHCHLIDGHNDLLWRIREQTNGSNDLSLVDLSKSVSGDTDIPRLKKGMVAGQFWSVWIPPEIGPPYAKVQLEQIELANRLFDEYSDVFTKIRTPADFSRAFKEGKIASLIAMEGSYGLENSLSVLRSYYALGVRAMSFTHSSNLDWADAATDSVLHGGLTPFGKDVVKEMNRLGMMIDLSHVSEKTASDVLAATQAPIFFSHSSARQLTRHPRNVSDTMLKKVKKNGGVIMVTFVPAFISQEVADWESEIKQKIKGNYLSTEEINALYQNYNKANPMPTSTIADVADHIDYIANTIGADHVGIGSDFWGGKPVTEGLEDVSAFPALFAELIRRGWAEDDLKKLAGGNILRVFDDVYEKGRELRKEFAPLTTQLETSDAQ